VIKLHGYFVDNGEVPGPETVFVAIQEGTQWTSYSPVGQHSNTDPAYVVECSPITKEEYMKHGAGFYTPPEYLV
jgi:hypothetical protein